MAKTEATSLIDRVLLSQPVISLSIILWIFDIGLVWSIFIPANQRAFMQLSQLHIIIGGFVALMVSRAWYRVKSDFPNMKVMLYENISLGVGISVVIGIVLYLIEMPSGWGVVYHCIAGVISGLIGLYLFAPVACYIYCLPAFGEILKTMEQTDQ